MVLLNDKLKLGLQSWSLRGLKNGNEDIVKVLKECDLDCLEITKVHVDFENEEMVDKILALYKENNITISSCGVCSFTNDLKANRAIFSFAKKAGIKAISAMISKDAFEICENLCEEYGIKLAIHNHGRSHEYGTFEKLDEVMKKTSKNIGVCIDLAWMLDAGHDPIEAVLRYSGRVYGIHFKDFIIKDSEKTEVVLGKGDLDLKACVDIIKETQTIEYASIEYEEDEENPVDSIKECVSAIKSCI